MSTENQATSPPAKAAPVSVEAARQKTPLAEAKANARIPGTALMSPTDAALSPCTKLLSKPKGKRATFSRMPKKVLMKQISTPEADLKHIEEKKTDDPTPAPQTS